MTNPIYDFIHEVSYDAAPEAVQRALKLALLDLLGVAAVGTTTKLSKIICEHATLCFGAGEGSRGSRILFDGRKCSAPGAALAGGMTIDSVDAHDGHKPTKGHVGCGVLPAALAFAEIHAETSESEFLNQLLLGYEIGSRAGVALHATAPDYHTSGAWVALACAAIGCRSLRLDSALIKEALGIAEYHGPRSQMMRAIDHPTMLKDGSGVGAMTGVSAALLAQGGFTGSPALTVESSEVAELWNDLGSRWRMLEQYVKAYPVCRWAQPAIAAVLKLQSECEFRHKDIKRIEVGTFHESSRLACIEPRTTEEAQYSLPFPVAVAVVHGDVGIAHIDGRGLQDTDVLRISRLINIVEVDEYNKYFPQRRVSRVQIDLHDGRTINSGPMEAAGDPENPLAEQEIIEKFLRYSSPVLSEFGAIALRDTVLDLGNKDNLNSLSGLIYRR